METQICKNLIFKKHPLIETQNPSRYYNSITNLKFQHKSKYHLSKNSSDKNRPVINQGTKSLVLLYSTMNLNTISLAWQSRPINQQQLPISWLVLSSTIPSYFIFGILFRASIAFYQGPRTFVVKSLSFTVGIHSTLSRSWPFRIAVGNDLTPGSRAHYSPCLSHGQVDKTFQGPCIRPGTRTHSLLGGLLVYHMQYPVLIVSPSPTLSISTLDSKRQFEYHHRGLFNALGFITYNICC